MDIKIEQNIPIPDHKNRGRKRSSVPFDQLTPKSKNCLTIKLKSQKEFSSIRQRAQYLQRKTGAKYSCLFFPEEGIGRVWRLT